MARPTLMPAAMIQGRTPRRGPRVILSRRRRRSRTRGGADADAAVAAGDAVASADDDDCGDDVASAVAAGGVVASAGVAGGVVASAGVGIDVVDVPFDQFARRFVVCSRSRRTK